jgi:hypothetical protein
MFDGAGGRVSARHTPIGTRAPIAAAAAVLAGCCHAHLHVTRFTPLQACWSPPAPEPAGGTPVQPCSPGPSHPAPGPPRGPRSAATPACLTCGTPGRWARSRRALQGPRAARALLLADWWRGHCQHTASWLSVCWKRTSRHLSGEPRRQCCHRALLLAGPRAPGHQEWMRPCCNGRCCHPATNQGKVRRLNDGSGQAKPVLWSSADGYQRMAHWHAAAKQPRIEHLAVAAAAAAAAAAKHEMHSMDKSRESCRFHSSLPWWKT